MFAIIGSNGQLGWELVRKGEARGLKILALDYPEIDIGDPASIDACFDSTKIDLVINAAAYTAVDRAESEPEAAFAVNREGPAHLADRCRKRGIPLIHVSTDYVFDGTKTGPTSRKTLLLPWVFMVKARQPAKLKSEKRLAGAHHCADSLALWGTWSQFRENHAKDWDVRRIHCGWFRISTAVRHLRQTLRRQSLKWSGRLKRTNQ